MHPRTDFLHYCAMLLKKFVPLAILIAIMIEFGSCVECYETSEPIIFVEIHNRPVYEFAEAEDIISPISFLVQDSSFVSSSGTSTFRQEIELTLPLKDTTVTYIFPYRDSVGADTLEFSYFLDKFYQSDQCGYVVKIEALRAVGSDSIPTFHLNDVPHSYYVFKKGFSHFMSFSDIVENGNF